MFYVCSETFNPSAEAAGLATFSSFVATHLGYGATMRRESLSTELAPHLLLQMLWVAFRRNAG